MGEIDYTLGEFLDKYATAVELADQFDEFIVSFRRRAGRMPVAARRPLSLQDVETAICEVGEDVADTGEFFAEPREEIAGFVEGEVDVVLVERHGDYARRFGSVWQASPQSRLIHALTPNPLSTSGEVDIYQIMKRGITDKGTPSFFVPKKKGASIPE
jgi:hypothetical protein